MQKLTKAILVSFLTPMWSVSEPIAAWPGTFISSNNDKPNCGII
jgi:hypothetical protein